VALSDKFILGGYAAGGFKPMLLALGLLCLINRIPSAITALCGLRTRLSSGCLCMFPTEVATLMLPQFML